MKLIFAGTDKEKEWFKDVMYCPHGVPCPKYFEHGVLPIDQKYQCKDCYAYQGTSENVTYVDELPDTSSTDKGDIVAQLKKHVERFKNCDECTFSVDGKCFFDYNCPADFEKRNGSDKYDDMPVSEDN